MRIVLYGATGTIGRRIAREALDRGHTVTAVVRNPSRSDLAGENLTLVEGDVRDPASVARLAAGQDAVVSAISPGSDQDPAVLPSAAKSLVQGLTQAGVRRLVIVNGAGSLEVAPGVQIVDTPEFPDAWRPVALAHRDALDVLRASNAALDWTAFSPAALIMPGERTGQYRTGTDQVVADQSGKSYISAEDYAVALLDELETPQHIGQRFTAAY